MTYIPMADVVVGPVFWLAGLMAAGVLLVMIVLLEGVVLRLLNWASFGRSLWDALLMNLGSAVPGLLVALAGISGILVDMTWIGFLVAFLLSAAIEGGILMLLKRRPRGETWRAALLANLVSYLAFGLLYLFS
jgi:hypothetical protein